MLYHHTVVIKVWRDAARDLLCRTILSWRHIIGMRGKQVNVSNTKQKNELQQITWRHAQNVVSPWVLCKFVNLISTLVICLKFDFIEMLDKLNTYIVCWYNILYQVLPVVWTSRITTRRYRDSVVILVHTTGSTWYKVLFHHTMHVMVIFIDISTLHQNSLVLCFYHSSM